MWNKFSRLIPALAILAVLLIVLTGSLVPLPAFGPSVLRGQSQVAPQANAGVAQTGAVGETMILDGRGSSDMNGDRLTFTWTMVTKPERSVAALRNPTSVMPSFDIDEPGIYIAQLIVNDGRTNSVPDMVVVTTGNSAPVANAGQDQKTFVGETVVLDSSGSGDVNGDRLRFIWSFTMVPEGSTAYLSDPSAVTPQFEVDQLGTYIAQLIVNDGVTDSQSSTVTITTENSRPMANAGRDQTAAVGDLIVLDGSQSFDANKNTRLTYVWSLVAVPPDSVAELSDRFVSNPNLAIDQPGTYVAQLIVNDGTINSEPSQVVISTTNSRPIADAGTDQTGSVGETITLNASRSLDQDGDQLSYRWSLINRPDDSNATIKEIKRGESVLVPDEPGIYIPQLIVSDGLVGSKPTTVKVVVGGSDSLDSNDGSDSEKSQDLQEQFGLQADSKFSSGVPQGLLSGTTKVMPVGDVAVQSAADTSITPYGFEVISQTDTSFGVGTIANLGTGPSINDSGKVAFIARVQPPEQGPNTAQEGVFIGDGKTVEKRTGLVNSFFYNAVAQINSLDTAFSFGDFVQINNQEQVVWRAQAHDGLFSFILRLGTTSNDFKLVAKNFFPRIDFPELESTSPFSASPILAEALRLGVTLNNRVGSQSRVVFSGILKDNLAATVLSTPLDTETGGHDLASDFNFSAALSGFPEFFPMITDEGQTIVRGGAQPSAPLTLFVDEMLNTAIFVASTTNDFSAIGQRPGISDDGNLIAFVAAHNTQGVGIFVSAKKQETPTTVTYTTPTKIAGGEFGLSAFDLNSRVGVNHSVGTSPDNFSVVFLAKRGLGGPSSDDLLGLYAVTVDLTEPALPTSDEPNRVIEEGQTIVDLPGQIDSIKLYDPVNNRGEVAFWVKTNAQSQAIVRAQMVTIEATKPIAVEGDSDHLGEFTITRSGSVDEPLVVEYSIEGSANENDFETLAGTVTIESGKFSAQVNIEALEDMDFECSESVQLSLAMIGNETVISASKATVSIVDSKIFNQGLSCIDRWWATIGDPQFDVTWALPISQGSDYVLRVAFDAPLPWDLSELVNVTIDGGTLLKSRHVTGINFLGEVVANLGKLDVGFYTVQVSSFIVPPLGSVQSVEFELLRSEASEAELKALFVADLPDNNPAVIFPMNLTVDGEEKLVLGFNELVARFTPTLVFDDGVNVIPGTERFPQPYDAETIFARQDVFDGAVTGANNQQLDLSPLDVFRPSGIPAKIYGSVQTNFGDFPPMTGANELAINYWFHYPRSNWKEYGGANEHEGDWEGITIFLSFDGINWQPDRIAFGQHVRISGAFFDGPFGDGGDTIPWSNVDRRKEADLIATHTRVYVGLGGHASYEERGRTRWPDKSLLPFLEKIEFHRGDLPVVSSNGVSVEYLRRVGAGPESKGGNVKDWLIFPGHWGAEDLNGEETFLDGDGAPRGPVFVASQLVGNKQMGQRWLDPWAWSKDFSRIPLIRPLLPGWITEALVNVVDDGSGINSVVQLTEGSDAAIRTEIVIPGDFSRLQFDFHFTQKGNGDIFVTSINGNIISTILGTEDLSTMLESSDAIDISAFSGQTVELEFRLKTMGSVDSQVWLDNIMIFNPNAAPLAFAPNVIDQPLALARQTLLGEGLTISSVTPEISASIPAGFVISQIPVDGTSVPLGSSVALTASVGPLPVFLDVDGNGEISEPFDGQVILRYLFGLRGDALVDGVVDLVNGTRTTSEAVVSYLDPLKLVMLDVDCSGKANPMTDGLLISRFLSGLRGSDLTTGVVDSSGCRTTADEIEPFLVQFAVESSPLSLADPQALKQEASLNQNKGSRAPLRGEESEVTVSSPLVPSAPHTQAGIPTSQRRPFVQVVAINGKAIESGRSKRIPISVSDLDDSSIFTVELAATNVSLNTSINLYLSSKGKRNDRHIFEAASLTGSLAHSTSVTTMTLPDDFVEGFLRVVLGGLSSKKNR